MGKLRRWDLWYIWCSELPRPHDKYCICIDPDRRWFFFVNSERPYARKARQLAIEIAVHEIQAIRHTSFIDCTFIVSLNAGDVQKALNEPSRRKESVSPSLRQRIRNVVNAHGFLTKEQKYVISLN